jgi:hypothetical protein
MRKQISFTIIFFTLAYVMLGQADMTELDRKYTPLSSTKKRPVGANDGLIGGVRNGVSFEILGLSRGQLSFEYQREVFVPNVVGMVSLGAPILGDFVHRFYGTEWASFTTMNNELGYDQLYTNGATLKAAPWFQAGIRVLFDDPEDLDGRGIELRFRTQTERLDFSGVTSDFYDFSLLPSDYEVRHRTLFISYRAQSSSAPRSRFISGLSYGLGIRMVNYPTIRIEEDNSFMSSLSKLSLDGSRKELVMISVLLSYSIGFGW